MNPNDENNDPVWKLLGKARKQEPGPYFARNVLREVRKLKQDTPSKSGFWAVFFARPAWVGAVAATVALAVGAFFLVNQNADDGGSTVQTEVAPVEAVLSVVELDEEIDSLDYLDELLAVQDTVLLSDADIASLLF